jgi:hypothetical protein
MSFNRIKYDSCAYDLQMGRSTGPGDYRLYAPYAENCDQCISLTGPVGAKSDVSLVKENMELSFKDMAQVESELSWRNQLLTKCNLNSSPIGKHKVNHKQTCSKKLEPEDTRFTHPIDNYRSMSLTSFQVEPYLHVNPQCHVQESGDRIGLNSRLRAKDLYKMPEQEFWDKGEALPKEIKQAKQACPV